MIAQDQFSGSLHEMPEPLGDSGYGEPVYDGLGNPVGFIGPLSRLVRNIPIVGGLVNRLFPGGRPPGFPFPMPALPGFPPPPIRVLGRRPWPLGWSRPPLPYTGLGPRRLYMRCAVWPGPKGLVPSYAQNMPPGLLPGMPGFPGMPGMPGAGGGRRRRRRRR